MTFQSKTVRSEGRIVSHRSRDVTIDKSLHVPRGSLYTDVTHKVLASMGMEDLYTTVPRVQSV